MSSNTQPSPPRAGSYILVPSSNPLDSDGTSPDVVDPYRGARPRLFWLLPLVAALDIALSITLGVLVLRQEASHHDADTTPPISNPDPPHDPILLSSNAPTSPRLDDAAWERRKVLLFVLVFSLARALSYLIVGISIRIRQLGVTVAATSILSTLFYVSVANLLFQARPKPDVFGSLLFFSHSWSDAFRHLEPTMPVLVGTELGMTLLEWVLYIAVVGVRVPPGGSLVKGRRWARGLAEDEGYQRGVDAHSLYPSDGEEGEEDEHADDHLDSHQDDGSPRADDVEQARSLLASPISPVPRRAGSADRDASNQPLLGASPITPRGYGSTLTTAPPSRTPQTPSRSHSHAASAHTQGSVRSNRSARNQGMSRSASARSGIYSSSPNAAELGNSALTPSDDDEDEEAQEEDAEGSDPDDIIDITPNRAVARKEARLRLARAALPERRASGSTLSTLNIFGGDPLSPNAARGEARGNNVFSDEAGSPLGRNTRAEEQQMPQTLLSVANPPSDVGSGRPGALGGEGSRQSSLSLLPSSSSTRTTSTKGSGSNKKFKLPKWMKPGSRKK